jgi:hypothetical protein
MQVPSTAAHSVALIVNALSKVGVTDKPVFAALGELLTRADISPDASANAGSRSTSTSTSTSTSSVLYDAQARRYQDAYCALLRLH